MLISTAALFYVSFHVSDATDVRTLNFSFPDHQLAAFGVITLGVPLLLTSCVLGVCRRLAWSSAHKQIEAPADSERNDANPC
jgi:hypothetical protein